jgi:hypothetical protein
MDEVLCYVDMTMDFMLHFRGSKSAEGANTGYQKHRYTVCLTACVSGRILATTIILESERTLPKSISQKVKLS